MKGLGRPGWLFLHKRTEHVGIWPPSSAGAWAGRGKGRWLEHERLGPPGVVLPSQKGRTCVHLAARLGRGVGGAREGEVAEHEGPGPPGVALPSQKGRTCVHLAAKLGRGVGGAREGEVAGT